jgi:hypothetical protein
MRMGGTLAEVICSAMPETSRTRDIATVHGGAELEDVDVGAVRAAFGVAETDSVWLSEREFGVDAPGFLPRHLVVLLDAARYSSAGRRPRPTSRVCRSAAPRAYARRSLPLRYRVAGSHTRMCP